MMENQKGTLEATYEVKNLVSKYYESHQEWSHANMAFIFKVKDEGENGELKILDRDVNVVNIKDCRNRIKEFASLFFLSFKFLSGLHNLNYQETCLRFFNSCFDKTINSDQDIDEIIKKIKYQKNKENENIHSAILTCGIGLGMSAVAKIDPVPLPDFSALYPSLYIFSANCRRPLITYIQTKELGDIIQEHPDDMLKRWFLILEELEDTSNDDCKDIKSARNFVSHKAVHSQKTMETIKQELGAYVSNSGKYGEARFDRSNQDHIKFVQKYAMKAEERARKLLMQQLEQHHD